MTVLPDRLEVRTAPPNGEGCRRWLGSFDRDGYPRIQGKTWEAAHRLAYESLRSIDPGMAVHHVCHHRWCVEPTHLEQVDPVVHGSMHVYPARRCLACGVAFNPRRPNASYCSRKCGQRERFRRRSGYYERRTTFASPD